jgi:hypothetical protein
MVQPERDAGTARCHADEHRSHSTIVATLVIVVKPAEMATGGRRRCEQLPSWRQTHTRAQPADDGNDRAGRSRPVTRASNSIGTSIPKFDGICESRLMIRASRRPSISPHAMPRR